MSRDLPEMMSTDYVQRMQQWVGDSTEGTSQDNLQNLIVWKRTDSLLLDTCSVQTVQFPFGCRVSFFGGSKLVRFFGSNGNCNIL